MIIVKKDGYLEDFYIDKLITSIKNAFSDCNQILNQSDIDYIKKTFNSKLTKFIRMNPQRNISSLEIKMFLFETLKECRFTDAAENYILF